MILSIYIVESSLMGQYDSFIIAILLKSNAIYLNIKVVYSNFYHCITRLDVTIWREF